MNEARFTAHFSRSGEGAHNHDLMFLLLRQSDDRGEDAYDDPQIILDHQSQDHSRSLTLFARNFNVSDHSGASDNQPGN